MRVKPWAKMATGLSLMLLLAALPLVSACGPAEPGPAEEEPTPEAEVSEFDAVEAAIEKYQPCGKAWHIKAEDVFLLLNDDDEDNDPFIVSVREAKDYAKGNIPGAVHIPFADIAKKETLASLPKDKKIVFYCDTGQNASQAMAMLGAMGYDVQNMMHGISAWTKDTEVAPKRFSYEKQCMDYEFETTPNEATKTYPFPTIENTTSTDAEEIVRAAAQAFSKPRHITVEDLFLLLNDDDEDNDPFILSVRKPEDYAKGHVPGAVNIECGSLLTKEGLAKLDPDKQIVVYCYTGQNGSHATSLLNMLGYDAINLKFGMVGWTSDADVAPKAFNNETDCMDYELDR
ncbi:MAG: rhodanese-like domain-containing protein [Dehalococcoidia bacterium]|nr:rhodanese-like domain-containing protein [Dehalococcoidia bacterium]